MSATPVSSRSVGDTVAKAVLAGQEWPDADAIQDLARAYVRLREDNRQAEAALSPAKDVDSDRLYRIGTAISTNGLAALAARKDFGYPTIAAMLADHNVTEIFEMVSLYWRWRENGYGTAPSEMNLASGRGR